MKRKTINGLSFMYGLLTVFVIGTFWFITKYNLSAYTDINLRRAMILAFITLSLFTVTGFAQEVRKLKCD